MDRVELSFRSQNGEKKVTQQQFRIRHVPYWATNRRRYVGDSEQMNVPPGVLQPVHHYFVWAEIHGAI
jgi:hypothetical protein